jgi:uncharacterized damage-inducible protein DinB
MTVERTDPPYVVDGERAMLDYWLEYHRATLAIKCDGLSDDQLRQRAVPPSSLSLLGLVRHMAEVERSWFRRALAGEDVPGMYYSDEDPDGDFDNISDASVSEAFASWHRECDVARRNAAAAESLDVQGTRRGRDTEEPVSLRWIMLHMIEEYARHNGHADLIRERIDGTTGE